ncbi:MAG: oxygen-dependent coproporphyrinogen oxidase [Gammaproteobacteria bacterium]|nr:oxygen-dependent coproporphyrinogen oxidase [Gammaproteobacteria bacterium]|tara:strand:+ start:918 stop:1838 length:921 start_codon:yes stop_codon:yes gene_type:complete
MNISDRQDYISKIFKDVHKNIFDQIKMFEDKSKIQDDVWHKKELGNGNSVVIDDGNFFDKAGINFSSISGKSLPESSVGNKSKSMGLPFFATGVSVVFHPKNPYIPTAHLNVRYFCTYKKNQVFEEWFGGGFDLTPYILDEEDCKRWHKGAKGVCGLVDGNFYKVSKKNCDEYFYIPHRKEHRGIGGIFYEKKKFEQVDQGLNFSHKVAESFIENYVEIVNKHKSKKYNKEEKKFQRFRRGRYVEFNLTYDRGTLFGLQSGGRIESILMSLPNEVEWHYKFDEELTNEQQKLYEVLKKPRNWIDDV